MILYNPLHPTPKYQVLKGSSISQFLNSSKPTYNLVKLYDIFFPPVDFSIKETFDKKKKLNMVLLQDWNLYGYMKV